MTELPKALVEALESDSRPLRPLPPVGRRMIWSLMTAAVVLGAGIVVLGLRADISSIPAWLAWGASGLEFSLAATLFILAIRESVPARAVPSGLAWTMVVVSLVFQFVVGYMTFRFSPGLSDAADPMGMGMKCMISEISMCLPTFLVTLWLIIRAWPLRAWMAGMLGGAGAAIATDALTHLHCPVSTMSHVLIWHGGAVILFTLGGALAGFLLGRFRD